MANNRQPGTGWRGWLPLGLGALAESVIGLFKTEVIRQRGLRKHLDDVEYATLEWVGWFNTTRLLGPIGDIPPAEYEANHYRRDSPATEAGLKQTSLRETRTGSHMPTARSW